MSDEPQFTPGPWNTATVIRQGKIYAAVIDGHLDRLCTMPDYGAAAQANADLLAVAPEMYKAEEDKIVHLQTLKNQIRCLLAPEKDTVVTLDFVLRYIDEIINDTENLLAEARGEN